MYATSPRSLSPALALATPPPNHSLQADRDHQRRAKPTAQFAATFGATSGAVRAWRPNTAAVLSACFVSLAMFAGAVAVL
jgi:hypothetical protein